MPDHMYTYIDRHGLGICQVLEHNLGWQIKHLIKEEQDQDDPENSPEPAHRKKPMLEAMAGVSHHEVRPGHFMVSAMLC